MCSKARHPVVGADLSSPGGIAAVVLQARTFATHGIGLPKLLQGRNLALVSFWPGGDAEAEFVSAATALGAHVSCVRLGLEQDSPQQIAATARVLARLYDALECQGLPAALVAWIASHTTIPVFSGLAMADHPTAALVDALGGDATPAARRRAILQAALVLSMP
jgi:ornithine carbamoyltransferase